MKRDHGQGGPSEGKGVSPWHSQYVGDGSMSVEDRIWVRTTVYHLKEDDFLIAMVTHSALHDP